MKIKDVTNSGVGYLAFTKDDVLQNGQVTFDMSMLKKYPNMWVSCMDILDDIRLLDIPDGAEVEHLVGSRSLEHLVVRGESVPRCIDCRNLKRVEIGNFVDGIVGGCFRGCISLENITLPKSVKYIYQRAFEDCASLKRIVIKGDIQLLSSDNGYDCQSFGSYFGGCTSLEEIVFENTQTGKTIWKKFVRQDPQVFRFIDSNLYNDAGFVEECRAIMTSAILNKCGLARLAKECVDAIMHKKSEIEFKKNCEKLGTVQSFIRAVAEPACV